MHLVSSVQTAVALGKPWAFTDRDADLGYALYFNSTSELTEVDWSVMPLNYWASSDDTKEKRQAESSSLRGCRLFCQGPRRR